VKQIDCLSHPRIAAMVRTTIAMAGAADSTVALDMFFASMREIYGARCVIRLLTQGLPAGSYRIVKWRDMNGHELLGGPGALEISADAAIQSGGFFGELVATPVPKLLHDVDVRSDPVVGGQLAGLASFLAVPLYDSDGIYYWAVFGYPDPNELTLEELEQTIVRASLISTTVGSIVANQRLREATRWIDGEIEQIAGIQHALLPQRLPTVPGVSLAASYRTFDRAGGDYYDVFPLAGGDAWGILIADASGHGPSAAVVAAMVNAILYTYPGLPAGPGDMLEYLNRHLHARNFDGSFVTALLAFYEPRTRRVRCASAGHNPPLLRRGDGGVDVLQEIGGLPLGVEDAIGANEVVQMLEPGQTLLLYTDGVIDERDAKDVPFGLDRLVRFVAAHGGDAETLVARLTDEMIRYQGITKPEDDQTILAVHATDG